MSEEQLVNEVFHTLLPSSADDQLVTRPTVVSVVPKRSNEVTVSPSVSKSKSVRGEGRKLRCTSYIMNKSWYDNEDIIL